MTNTVYYIISAVLVLGVLLGIYLMSKVKSSVKGNAISAVSMALAIITVLVKYEVFGANQLAFVLLGLLIGSAAGVFITVKVKMIQMPQTVALLNGFGGGASAIVGAITIANNGFEEVTSVLAVVVGMVTLVGSLIAAAKLQGLISPRPKVYPGHKFITTATLIFSIACCVAAPFVSGIPAYILLAAAFIVSGLFGYFFSVRVGGADMPITISLLNSFSGVAGSIAGLAIGDALLVAVGGIVGASGLILTQIMCRAMNRHLFDILLGKTSAPAKPAQKATLAEVKEEKPAEEPKKEIKLSPEEEAAGVLKKAKNVIIIPGYGMALGQAQSLVKQLSDKLESNGANVKFAIHPVAGRMPGHMNVLLCEVDVPYEKLYEMDAINSEFSDCDVAVIIGANDVVNPAAREAEGTPIYGMPVLEADKSKHVIVFNYDLKPGYAGVPNPLYSKESGVTLLLGDAKQTIMSVMGAMNAEAPKEETAVPADIVMTPDAEAASVLKEAKNVIIIPGYGMALGQAQSLVKQLSDKLESNGANVKFAIHPVAGRMPGHMNVLLCEVDVPYEKLYEMDAINGEFSDCDVAIIVGANDVVNPAAREAEGTPIYGMPVLEADKAKHVVVFNYDLKPGYAGVPNPLYTKDSGVTLLLGDAKTTLMSVMSAMDLSPAASVQSAAQAKKTPDAEAAGVLKNAKNVIVIPGYGMALGQAQSLVKQLSDKLEANGADVKFAIHPVAGRMPGHMNVLLCEVDVPYEKLYEMDAINGEFDNCDVAIIVGANDVVNPAAREAEGTPIYGMPVLEADKAKHVVIFNYDLKPGYAGVENPLYTKESGVTLLLGDAKETLMSVMGAMDSVQTVSDETPAAVVEKKTADAEAADVLRDAKNIIIIPGYGMALGQAQSLVKQLSDKLEANGAEVRFAIHPVAGRMPGHMNVLLCEVDVPYEKLYEMDAINGEFGDCDAAIIVGANDVVNPAAREAEGTPIYGMPVLEADKAKHVVIFNYDLKPGYAGVENPLYTRESGVTLLLGDAKETLLSVLSKI